MMLHTNTVKAACLLVLLAACGDDGTERLSTCPDARIVTDKMGVIRCAGPKKPEDSSASAAGKAASTGDSPSTMQANRASQDGASASGNAKTPAADSGSMQPSMGGAGKPAAESGNQPPAESGGSATPPSSGGNVTGGGSWYCVQVMNACSCVMGAVAGDTCEKPIPTCCVSVKNDAAVNTCVCYPEGSTECTGVKGNPSVYPPVSGCPPK